MKVENLPENPTAGVVRRTLRGMDGRIKHVEDLAARWSPKRIDGAITAALAPVLAEIAAIREDIKTIFEALPPSPAPVPAEESATDTEAAPAEEAAPTQN